MNVLLSIIMLILTTSPVEKNAKTDSSTSEVNQMEGNVGSTIVDDLNGLIR